MTSFVTIPIETDPDALTGDAFDRMDTAFPGWTPDEGAVETWLIRILSAVIGAPLAEVAADVPPEVFRRFGETVHGVVPLAAVSATATVTINVADTAGYVVPAGTQVAIAATGDVSYGFTVLSDATIPAGSSSVTGVTVQAITPGTAANGLTADPTLVDSLAYVTSIVQTSTASSGGVDAETGDEYLDRLTATLQTLSQNIVLPRDAEILALSVAGVARATALDGYDADTETTGNEKTVTVAVVDEDGAALSSTVKDAVAAVLAAHREVNFIFYVSDPLDLNTVKVSADVVPRVGADPAGTVAAVETAIQSYLDPATWGLPGENELGTYPGNWKNETVVRYLDIAALIENVESVDHIVSGTLQIALEAGSLGTSDVDLVGVAPLVEAGTLDINAA